MTRLKTYATNPIERALPGDAYPYYALEHIESGTGRLLPDAEIAPADDETAVLHMPGDVRFGRLRPYLAKSLLMGDRGGGSGELLVLRPREGVDSQFLHYVTLSKPFIEWAEATAYGVKMPRTNWSSIANFPCTFPPLDQQKRIVKLIVGEIERIDSVLNEQSRVLALQRERLEAWRESAFGNRGDVEWTPLHRLVDPARPVVYGIVQAGPEVADGVPYIKTGDVENLEIESLSRTSPEIDSLYRRAHVHPGDIVVAMRASIGAAVRIPIELPVANLTQGTARFAPAVGINGEWLLHAFRTKSVQEQAMVRSVGSTFRTLNIWDLRRLPIPTPPPAIRDELARAAKDHERRLRELESATAFQRAALCEHRVALVTTAVTGGPDTLDQVA